MIKVWLHFIYLSLSFFLIANSSPSSEVPTQRKQSRNDTQGIKRNTLEDAMLNVNTENGAVLHLIMLSLTRFDYALSHYYFWFNQYWNTSIKPVIKEKSFYRYNKWQYRQCFCSRIFKHLIKLQISFLLKLFVFYIVC